MSWCACAAACHTLLNWYSEKRRRMQLASEQPWIVAKGASPENLHSGSQAQKRRTSANVQFFQIAKPMPNRIGTFCCNAIGAGIHITVWFCLGKKISGKKMSRIGVVQFFYPRIFLPQIAIPLVHPPVLLCFSGQTGITVPGAVELARIGGRRWLCCGLAIVVFEATNVSLLRSPYTTDVFTSAVAARYATILAARIVPMVCTLSIPSGERGT